ncbi:MAG: dockerin type I repeat-containing protein, partial [Spirochaetales bacterium]|nr:dockerin type I repeat-containing protein [Spirochaetales bacterium]
IPVYDGSTLLYGLTPAGGSTTAPTTAPTAAPTNPPAQTTVPTSAPTNPAVLLGDVNSDGSVDIVDALLIAQWYVQLDPLPFNVDAADTNCSGSVDIVDALLIAQYYVGLINGFC